MERRAARQGSWAWVAGLSADRGSQVVALSVPLGFATGIALSWLDPGWERIFLVVGLLGGFLATRPVRWALGQLERLAMKLQAGAAGVVVFAVGLAEVVKPEWIDAKRIALGIAIFASGAVLGRLDDYPMSYRMLALPGFWIGVVGGALLWRWLNPESALDPAWFLAFVPLVLAGIAAADLLAYRLEDWVFRRVPWELVLLLGVAGAALLYFQVAPRLEEEDERVERKPILPISNGPLAHLQIAGGQVAVNVAGESSAQQLIRSVKPDSRVSWSPDGTTLVFVRPEDGERGHIWTFDTVEMKETRLTREPVDYDDPTWSPDGARIAFSMGGSAGRADIYVASSSPWSRAPTRLTTNRHADLEPTWSPDGEEIAFASDRTGQFDIYVIAADGTRVARLSRGAQFSADDRQPAWSPHGRTIAFVSRTATAPKADIYLVDADGRGPLTNLTKSASTSSTDPAWAPDGTAIAFTRVDGKRRAVHRIALQGVRDPGVAEPVEEAPGPSFLPAWRPLPDPDMPPHWNQRLVERYAPLVRLHTAERYWPMGASQFIRSSRLDWVGCDARRIADPPVELRLGGGERPGDTADAYQLVRSTCAKRQGTFSVHDRTRPSDRDDEGFVLTPNVDVPRGPAPTVRQSGSSDPDLARHFVEASVPVYFEHVPRRSITYWLFYGFSATNPAGRSGEHQGDWERITVCLDRSERAISVVYHRHRFNRARRWSLVPKFGTHPIAYSANGSHASYSSAGTNPVLETFDRRDEGAIWATWENLRNVLGQKWYGYGGSWGRPPGPDGPSRFKVGDEGC